MYIVLAPETILIWPEYGPEQRLKHVAENSLIKEISVVCD
jgi:hypothetical protein